MQRPAAGSARFTLGSGEGCGEAEEAVAKETVRVDEPASLMPQKRTDRIDPGIGMPPDGLLLEVKKLFDENGYIWDERWQGFRFAKRPLVAVITWEGLRGHHLLDVDATKAQKSAGLRWVEGFIQTHSRTRARQKNEAT